MELQTGTHVDRYTVQSVLGEGGMAVVYLCRHNQLGTLHALKVLTMSSRAIRERLVQEGQVQASLRHRNIVAVTDIVTVGGAPGLIMEYIEGPSLDELLEQQRLSYEQVEVLADGILSGVAHAHAHGLIHRDLKPANVMLALEGRSVLVPKVTDFGLAKLVEADPGRRSTRTGSTMGTPHYMSPEQVADSKNVDARTDVFALGAILYEMVCGQRAFGGENLLKIFTAVAEGRYQPPRDLAPDLPERMERAILGALEPDRDQRIQSVEALMAVWSGQADHQGAQPKAPEGPFDAEFVASLRSISADRDHGTPSQATWDGAALGSVASLHREPGAASPGEGRAPSGQAASPAQSAPSLVPAVAASQTKVPEDQAPDVPASSGTLPQAPPAPTARSVDSSSLAGSIAPASKGLVAGSIALGGGALLAGVGALAVALLVAVGAGYLAFSGSSAPASLAAEGAADPVEQAPPTPPGPPADPTASASAAPADEVPETAADKPAPAATPPAPAATPPAPAPAAAPPAPAATPSTAPEPVAPAPPVPPDEPVAPVEPIAPDEPDAVAVADDVPGALPAPAAAPAPSSPAHPDLAHPDIKRRLAAIAEVRNAPGSSAALVDLARNDPSRDVQVHAWQAVTMRYQHGIGDRATHEALIVEALKTGSFSRREASSAYAQHGTDLDLLVAAYDQSNMLFKMEMANDIAMLGLRIGARDRARQLLQERHAQATGLKNVGLRTALKTAITRL